MMPEKEFAGERLIWVFPIWGGHGAGVRRSVRTVCPFILHNLLAEG